MNLDDIIQETKTYNCLECGKCTSVCPVARHDPSYSPRAIIEDALLGFEDELVFNQKLFSCLTCYTCQQLCPSGVDFPVFTQKARAIAQNNGQHGVYAHSGQLQSLARLMASPDIKQRRLEWLSEKYRISDKSDILLWIGCAPYFEPIFEDVEFRALDITEASLRILNLLGIEPKLLSNEKCCGHDVLWTGDIETFNKLAEHNTRLIKEAGVKKIIFSCPEGYRTFKLDYPNHGFEVDCELQHISEFLAERIEKGGLKLNEVRKKVTYQDPCRLGRHLEVYDAPRKVLESIPGIEFVEMPHNRRDSICCGTSAFTNCDSYSNMIRTERLSEATLTGAETLITCCPKCQTHFKCAMVDKGEEKRPTPQIEVMDLANLVANAMGGQE
ncbi:MAG: (Fe-S)-binding protein [Dehalococcoidia bacterium]|nr:(Fe-S)-binding protein [Dehalococcoidia bacterium]